MQINSLALENHLKKHTPKFYLIWGADPFLIEESRRFISNHLNHCGVKQKTLLQIDSSEKGMQLLKEQFVSPSLFDNCKLILCVINKSLDIQYRKILAELLSQKPDSTYLLMQFEKVPTPQQKEAWYQFFLTEGLVVTHWPLTFSQYKQYLAQYAKYNGLTINNDGLELIASLTEGHALAGIQTLEKLKLILPESQQKNITEQHVFGAITQQSNYSLNDLYFAILENNSVRVQEILESFKETKVPLALIVWGLHQLLQSLISLQFNASSLYTSKPVLPKTSYFQNLISKKQALIDASLQNTLIHQLHHLDKQIKSFSTTQSWPLCLEFCIMLTTHQMYQYPSTQFNSVP